MTDTTGRTTFDTAEQLARIYRALDESAKFRAEQGKLTAEALKFERDRALAPWQVMIAGMAAGAAIFGAAVAFLKLLGP